MQNTVFGKARKTAVECARKLADKMPVRDLQSIAAGGRASAAPRMAGPGGKHGQASSYCRHLKVKTCSTSGCRLKCTGHVCAARSMTFFSFSL